MKTHEKTVCISDLDWFGKMCVCVSYVSCTAVATFADDADVEFEGLRPLSHCHLSSPYIVYQSVTSAISESCPNLQNQSSILPACSTNSSLSVSSLQCMNGTRKNANHRLTNHGMCELSASWPQALDSKVCLAATEAAPGRSGRKSCCLELH